MNEKMNSAINDQINAELYSSYLYLAMSAYCETLNFAGAGNWFKVQAYEEVTHAMKFYQYIVDRGGKVELGAIDKPPVSWKSLADAFQSAYQHELKVTERINNLVVLTREIKDFATENILQWFVAEQVEEEAHASEIADKIKMAGDNIQALFMIDAELSARALPVPITPVAGE